MRRNIEIRHYDRFGRPVRPRDTTGHYVLKIVWHRIGHDLRDTEKSGWLKAAPTRQTKFQTWRELWNWVAQTKEAAARARTSPRSTGGRNY